MWYTTTLNDQPALMFFDGNQRICFPVGENPYGYGDRFDAWLEEGNTPEPWEPES